MIKTLATEENKPVTVGLGQKTLADKIVHSVGLSTGTAGSEILSGGIAYLLSNPLYKKGAEKELNVQKLKAVLLANKVLVNKLFSAINDDLSAKSELAMDTGDWYIKDKNHKKIAGPFPTAMRAYDHKQNCKREPEYKGAYITDVL